MLGRPVWRHRRGRDGQIVKGMGTGQPQVRSGASFLLQNNLPPSIYTMLESCSPRQRLCDMLPTSSAFADCTFYLRMPADIHADSLKMKLDRFSPSEPPPESPLTSFLRFLSPKPSDMHPLPAQYAPSQRYHGPRSNSSACWSASIGARSFNSTNQHLSNEADVDVYSKGLKGSGRNSNNGLAPQRSGDVPPARVLKHHISFESISLEVGCEQDAQSPSKGQDMSSHAQGQNDIFRHADVKRHGTPTLQLVAHSRASFVPETYDPRIAMPVVVNGSTTTPELVPADSDPFPTERVTPCAALSTLTQDSNRSISAEGSKSTRNPNSNSVKKAGKLNSGISRLEGAFSSEFPSEKAKQLATAEALR